MKIEERRERKEKIKETQRKLKDYENKRKCFNIVFLMFCSFFLEHSRKFNISPVPLQLLSSELHIRGSRFVVGVSPTAPEGTTAPVLLECSTATVEVDPWQQSSLSSTHTHTHAHTHTHTFNLCPAARALELI